ncbi:MAG: hypothetical protein E6R03_00225 [Hyphomicrobiaceae bacterium]|nr:MAG: hypothetical protein E6R03_00225 [Hyphomicrobiaceae bacterium]
MPNIPLWLTGKHFTSMVMRRQAVGTDGALTNAGSDVTLTNYKNGFEFSIDPTVENINADNSTWEHEVIVADALRASVDLLMPHVGGDPNPVLAEFLAADIYKFTWVYGSGTSQKTQVAYMKRGPIRTNSTGRGAVKVSFELGPVDAGASTFAVS